MKPVLGEVEGRSVTGLSVFSWIALAKRLYPGNSHFGKRLSGCHESTVSK